uniref:MPN domain-containing protein n=1 Tax=Soboliphyme baturini TaxID=241478 RepID=A0A183IV01_9BILA
LNCRVRDLSILVTSAFFQRNLISQSFFWDLVVLKIIRNCEKERQLSSTEIAQGYLTGLIVGSRLEITNCFPIPKLRSDDDEELLSKHQEQMLRAFRNLNIDYLCVGWYQSCPFGTAFNETVFESMYEYQSAIEDCVCLVYDPVQCSQGILSIKAYRLSEKAMEFYVGSCTPEMMKSLGINYENLIEEVPLKIKNSHLVNIMMCKMAVMNASIQKGLRMLMANVDALNIEIVKYNRYVVAKQRYELNKETWMQKRQTENEARRLKGEPPLPTDEEFNKLFRFPAPPKMHEPILAAAEVGAYVEHSLKVRIMSV